MAANFTPGVVTVTVEYAQGLKDKQLFGRQDPYCVLRVGDQTARTRTVAKGGRDPVWNETFSFNVYRLSGLEIIVKDDRVLMDPVLGAAIISLDGVRAGGADKLVADVVSPSSRRQQGVISLSLQWKDGCPPEPEPKVPCMQAPGHSTMVVGRHHRMYMANSHAHHVAAHNTAMMHTHMAGHSHMHAHGHHHHHHGH